VSTLVSTFVQRRRADIAREKALRYLESCGLPPHMLELSEQLLRELDTDHRVWIGASELHRQWKRRRALVQCIKGGSCGWCGRDFDRGSFHWCTPGTLKLEDKNHVVD
jgi:hypothetical protein